MRIVSWNVRRAADASPVWDHLNRLNPDIALLQEVGSIPSFISERYTVAIARATKQSGKKQTFSNVIISRLGELRHIVLESETHWVNQEHAFFAGNILTCQMELYRRPTRIVCVYCPAWPIPDDHIADFDVSEIKLIHNPKVWLTEILWKLLSDNPDFKSYSWIVGGDFNSSETFDHCWKGGPRGNKEIIDRMNALGLYDALRSKNGGLVPTFKSPRGGKLIHQMDHLYMTNDLLIAASDCYTDHHDIIFGGNLSDHLPIIADLIMQKPNRTGSAGEMEDENLDFSGKSRPI